MREIKFRVWDKALKEIWYPTNDNTFGLFTSLTNELMQYTGLKDKNDKEIYEGDWFKSYPRIDPFIIIFHNGSFRGKYPKDDVEKGFHFDDYEAKQGEIIGNINENPELSK